jgi:hypothetical protein
MMAKKVLQTERFAAHIEQLMNHYRKRNPVFYLQLSMLILCYAEKTGAENNFRIRKLLRRAGKGSSENKKRPAKIRQTSFQF